MSRSAVADLLAQEDLWIAVGATLLAGLAGLVLGWRRLELWVVVVVGAVTASLEVGSVLMLVVALLLGLAQGDRRLASAASVSCSVLAVAAAYACTPDTERSVATLGAVGAAGALALACRLPWAGVSATVTALLVWIAATDGAPRFSAVAGTLGIALVHLSAQRSLTRVTEWRRRFAIVGLVALGAGLLSREAGVGPGNLRPIVTVAVVVVAVLVSFAVVVASGNEGGQELRPGPGHLPD